MQRFPDLPIYTGFNTPSRLEADVTDVEIEGAVPADLDGAFYRVGPDPAYPPLHGRDIYFNGDGMVSMFRFKGGRVDFKCRYARTDKLALEQAAGRALFGHYRNPYSDDPGVQGRIRGTANTNVVFHAGRLLALKEDSPPLAMDPLTLETGGYVDFDGALKSATFTAHPKIDPVNGEMIAFGYSATGIASNDVAYHVIDAQGRIVHEAWFEMPYPGLLHDFGVTQDYVVFPVVPCVASLDRAREGRPVYGWDACREVWIGVLPRRGTARELRWFRGPALFASHVMNAFNDGERVYIDMPVAEGNMFPFFPDITGAPFDPVRAQARVTRWTMDLSKPDTGFAQQCLAAPVGEFPRIDDRYGMQPYRHGFLAQTDMTLPYDAERGGSITGMFINCVGHIDLATGRSDRYFAGATTTLQEPCFIPKSPDAPEGEGYIAVLANRLQEMRSDLLLLDAQHLQDGPIATIHLPLRLRSGLHGNWVGADQLTTKDMHEPS